MANIRVKETYDYLAFGRKWCFMRLEFLSGFKRFRRLLWRFLFIEETQSWANADLTNIWYAIMLWYSEGSNQFLSNSLWGINDTMFPNLKRSFSARFHFVILIMMQSFGGLVNTLKLEVKVFFYFKRKLFNLDSNTTLVFIFTKPQIVKDWNNYL